MLVPPASDRRCRLTGVGSPAYPDASIIMVPRRLSEAPHVTGPALLEDEVELEHQWWHRDSRRAGESTDICH